MTRASPSYAEQGSQVNLWLVGQGFAPGAQVSFSRPGIEPALVNGQPIPNKVFPNADSENGVADGLQTFITIGDPAQIPAGFVDVTVTNPNGTQAVGRALLEIVGPGQIPAAQQQQTNIDSITGASPRAAFIGRRVALWIWGRGIDNGAQVTFESPAIRPFRPSEVVVRSQSHPGYSGIRNYLEIDPSALPGPVAFTITNPNGSQQRAEGLFQIVDGTGIVGEGGATADIGECPDLVTSIAGLTSIEPAEWKRGSKVRMRISGQAIACGAQVLIPGGGLGAVGQPRITRDPLNPFNTTLEWEIEVSPNASLGPRDITVINPNNTSKTLTNGVRIVEEDDGVNCQTGVGADTHWTWTAVLGLFCILLFRRRNQTGLGSSD